MKSPATWAFGDQSSITLPGGEEALSILVWLTTTSDHTIVARHQEKSLRDSRTTNPFTYVPIECNNSKILTYSHIFNFWVDPNSAATGQMQVIVTRQHLLSPVFGMICSDQANRANYKKISARNANSDTNNCTKDEASLTILPPLSLPSRSGFAVGN
jgi:hypothetical protein